DDVGAHDRRHADRAWQPVEEREERVHALRPLVGVDVEEEVGPKSASISGSVSLRSWRSTVWTAVIAHGKTASRMLRRRPASKDTGATRSAKYASRNEKVWSVKWPPARKTNALTPQSSGTTPL